MERAFAKAKKLNILLLVLAVAFGAAAGVSFSFHTGLAQNLSRLDKVIYFLFSAIPFSALFFLVVRQLTQLARTGSSLILLALSLLLGLGITFFAYPAVKPVRQHTVSIALPAETDPGEAYSLTITAAQIHDRVVQDLALAQLHTAGNAELTKDGILMLPGASVNLNAQYSGNLHVYLTPSQCPMPVELDVDGNRYAQDACIADTAAGLTFTGEDSGSLTPRWALLLQLLKWLDLLLFTLLAAGLLLLFTWVYTIFRRRRQPSADQAQRTVARFLLHSVLVLAIVTVVVFLTNLLSVVLLLPLMVFLVFDFLYLANNSRKQGSFLVYVAILAFFITAIVLNVTGSALYNRYLRPIPMPRHDKANSFNALVLSVFNGFEDSLLYGYDDVLRGRRLILSSRTSRLLEPDSDLMGRLQLSDLRIEEFEPQISSADFTQLLTEEHRTWDSGRWYRFYLMDGSAYQADDAVVAREYEDWILLLPAAVNERLGGGK